MLELSFPMSPQDVTALSVGERVSISGTVLTGREAVHRKLQEGGALPFEPRGACLFHCGPLVKRVGSRWEVEVAGPDDSRHLEPLVGEVLGRCGFAAVMGRGGTGPAMLAACRRYGAVYLQSFGGAGIALAKRVKAVKNVHYKDGLDPREACWELEVSEFPAIVTIDSHGRSLPDIVRDVSTRRLIALTD
ncbi:MAG: FumA C-terminus/TtdB family hydratase beta subunit [Planctomycetota bacterium]